MLPDMILEKNYDFFSPGDITISGFNNWRVQSSAKKRFTVKTESITGEDLQHLEVSIES